MMRLWVKAQKHPIWAEVIAGLILAAILAVVAWTSGLKWLRLRLVGETAVTPVHVPAILLVAITILASFTLVGWGRWLRPRAQPEPSPADYTCDTFFGLVWRWRWCGREIDELTAYCPTCDRILQVGQRHAYGEIKAVQYRCGPCGASKGQQFAGDINVVQNMVITEIELKSRTGEWLPIVEAQQGQSLKRAG